MVHDGPSIRTSVGSSSSTGVLLFLPTASTLAVFVYAAVVLSLSQVYSKYSPGCKNASLLSPEPPTEKLDHVLGNVPGSVTFPAQFGSIASVRTISFKSSVPLFVTLILNTAFSPTPTVCVSFPTDPSWSNIGFSSVLSMSTFGQTGITVTVF